MVENKLPYSTVGGYVTRGEIFAQLLDYLHLITDDLQRLSADAHWYVDDYVLLSSHLTLAEEAANVIGHLFSTEDDGKAELLAKGWYAVAEMLHNNRTTLNQLAQSPHLNRWAEVRQLYFKITHQVKQMHNGRMQ